MQQVPRRMHVNRLKSFTAVDGISLCELGAGYGGKEEEGERQTETSLLQGKSWYIFSLQNIAK